MSSMLSSASRIVLPQLPQLPQTSSKPASLVVIPVTSRKGSEPKADCECRYGRKRRRRNGLVVDQGTTIAIDVKYKLNRKRWYLRLDFWNRNMMCNPSFGNMPYAHLWESDCRTCYALELDRGANALLPAIRRVCYGVLDDSSHVSGLYNRPLLVDDII
jgi:hypothetical protein